MQANQKNYLDLAKENIEQFFSLQPTDLNQMINQELSKFGTITNTLGLRFNLIAEIYNLESAKK